MTNSTPVAALFAMAMILCSAALQASEQTQRETALLTGVFPDSCHFSGQFVQTKTMDGVPVPLSSEGDFFYSCDLGLVWRTRAPFEEAILYVNNSHNYRTDENGDLTPLTGIARYIMSSVFVRLLNGDTAYFLDTFAVSATGDDAVALAPQSDYMKKGLDRIVVKKTDDAKQGIRLAIAVTDATGQVTQVGIEHIEHYDIDGKRDAFDQCEQLYADTGDWCRVLRSPVQAQRR